ALGMPRGERHRIVTAHRVPDQRHACPAQARHQPAQILGKIGGRVGGRCRPLAVAVTALVEGDHVIAIPERGNDAIEPMRMRRTAVQETQGRCARRARLQEVQTQAIYELKTMFRRFTSEQLTRHGSRYYGSCHSVKRATQNFSWRVRSLSLLSEQRMFEVPIGPAARRPLLDAGYTVGLLATAILCGYGFLAPDRLGLAPVPIGSTRVVGAALVPPVGERPRVRSIPPVVDVPPAHEGVKVTPAAIRPIDADTPVRTARLTPDTRPEPAR